MSECRFSHVSPQGALNLYPTYAEANAAARAGGCVWFDYYKPSREELTELVDVLGLHPLSIEDCFDDNQVPKIEDFQKNTFFLFNAFQVEGDDLFIDEVNLFLGMNFLVTVSGYNSLDRRPLKNSQRMVEQNIENASQGPAFLMHVILDQVVDNKFTAIETLEENINRAEEEVLADSEHFEPGQLLYQRRDLLGIRKSLFHEREILVKICRKDCVYIPEKAIYHYRDIYDHLAKFFELTETSREVVTSLMEMYLTMLNNQMARAANQTNETVRRLTFITTIFMPLTLLAGIGGMSEYSMMTGPENWRIAYPAFLAGMIILGACSYIVLIQLEKRRPKS
jgi:magnesium transporter